MTPQCEQVLDYLGQGRLPAELEAHVKGCASCQAMLGAFGAMRRPMAPAPDTGAVDRTRAQVLQELAARPVAAPWWREAVWISALCLTAVVAATAYLGRHGVVLNRAPVMALVMVAVLLVSIIGWAAFVALAPDGRLLRRGLIAFAIETAGVVVLAGSGLDVPVPFFKAGVACFTTEVTVSAVPLAFAVWLLTRVAYNPARAFAAGLGTGAVGMLALHLHCPCGTLAHLLTFHVLPWLLLAGLAVLVRARLPSRSFAP